MAPVTKAETWTAVHAERQALIDDLAVLDAAGWNTASLCPGWDVHDVLADFVDSARTTRRGFMRGMLAARFDVDRANADGIRRA